MREWAPVWVWVLQGVDTSVTEHEMGAGKGWESLQTTVQVKEKEGRLDGHVLGCPAVPGRQQVHRYQVSLSQRGHAKRAPVFQEGACLTIPDAPSTWLGANMWVDFRTQKLMSLVSHAPCSRRSAHSLFAATIAPIMCQALDQVVYIHGCFCIPATL